MGLLGRVDGWCVLRCELWVKDGLGGVLRCIGLKARLFVQVDCIEFLHARVYILLGKLLVYCAWAEMYLPSGSTYVLLLSLLHPCSCYYDTVVPSSWALLVNASLASISSCNLIFSPSLSPIDHRINA
jgi:hypothetical protein